MNNSASNKRKRLTQACDCCRRMKVKCDTDKPACATCRRLNVTCTFLTGNKKRGPRQSSTSLKYGATAGSFSQTVMKFDGGKMVELIDNVPVDSGTTSSNEDTPNTTSTANITHLSFDTSLVSSSEPALKVQPISTPKSSGPEPCAPISCPKINEILETQEDNEASKDFCSLPFRKNLEQDKMFVDERRNLNALDNIHLTSQNPKPSAQEISEVHQLVDYYFENIHRHYPFIHPQGFKDKFHEVKAPSILINGICALSSRYRASTTGKVHDLSYATAIETQLFHIIDNPRLEYCQALLLMCVYELASGRLNRASTYSGIIIRMVQGLGLFRLDETYISAMDLTVNQWVRKEAARRIWWFSYILDTYVSAAINRPPLINEDDCCVMLPCYDQYWEEYRPVNTKICKFDKELSEQVVFMVTASNTGLLSTHVALVTVMARATRGIIRFTTLTTIQKNLIFPQVKQALGAWEANLPAKYKYRPEETIKEDPSLFAQIAFLDSMRHSIDIWIHLPLFKKPVPEQKITSNTPDIAETIKRCFMSAKMIAFAVQEVKSLRVIETHPMYGMCVSMAAQFFLQGCKSQDDGQAQRSLKFFRFLQNTLKEWKVLWGINEIHFVILNEYSSWLDTKRIPSAKALSNDKYSESSQYGTGVVNLEKSNTPAPWDSNFSFSFDHPAGRNESCEAFGQSLCDTAEFNDIVAQILAQNQSHQFDDCHDLHSKTLDEQYTSIWDSPDGLNQVSQISEGTGDHPHQIVLPHPTPVSHGILPPLTHQLSPTIYPSIDPILPSNPGSHSSSKSSESAQFGSS